ncbi:MAG: succinate dehydrogenase flavoprotein subunit, partial [Chlamydiae bacterium]|nr:succinate dehydrogenase flavoprotein subunit [Chlamydiota bacterium]
MGGAWVDWPAADDSDRLTRYRQMTNLPGCFNIGESDYQYHGANRLGANSLLSCIFSGLVVGVEIPRYLDSLTKHYGEIDSKIFEKALAEEENFKKELFAKKGKENVHKLHEELAEELVKHVTVKRDNHKLQETLNFIKKIRERFDNISLDDGAHLANQTYVFANQFKYMIELALAITKGALLRNEFRGSHFKPEFPQRDDEHWLKKTIASYDARQDEPVITYEPIDIRHLKPIKRDYSKAVKQKPHLENVPSEIKLPI